MYSIGEFSKITGLSVKTLRFYQEQGLLAPSYVDPDSGYRYYTAGKAEVARVIAQLRGLEFPLAEIAEMLASYDDDSDLLEHLGRQKGKMQERLRHLRSVEASLEQIIRHEQEARAAMQNASYEVEEKSLEPVLMAGVRIRGKYSDCSRGFSQIGRHFGRHICGPAFMLHYDSEYKEDDADFEACMPIRKGDATDAIDVRQLPGGRCVALLHRGPYDELGRSYEKILAYANDHGYEVELPTREVYLKGPGMIFKGNPKKYLTEIQMLVKETT